MYLFYLDESGDPHAWNNQENFILAGVAVHEGQIRNLSQELEAVQKHFFPEIMFSIEFHTSDIAIGKGRFRKMPAKTRMALLDEAYNVLANAKFPSLIAFITAIHETAVTSPEQSLKDCLEDICQRFNTFLMREYKKGYPNKGLMIIDRSGREKQLHGLMADFERHGTTHGFLGNIVDVPYFADSDRARMLQLADLVAYAAHKHFNQNDNTYLDKIWPCIDRLSPGREMVGFKHIVGKNHRCNCRAHH